MKQNRDRPPREQEHPQREEDTRHWDVGAEQSHRQMTNDSGRWRAEDYPRAGPGAERSPEFELGRANHDGPQYEQGGSYPGPRDHHALADYEVSENWTSEEPARRQRIDPKGYTRSDERIREDVCERLSRSGLDVSDVEVRVSDGWVELSGTVPNRSLKHEIENCADGCAGVIDVNNRVRIAGRPGVQPPTDTSS